MTQTFPNAYSAARRAMRIRRSTSATKLFIRAALELGKIEEVVAPLDLLKQSGNLDTDPDLPYLWSVYHQMKGDKAQAKQEKEWALSRDPDAVKRFHLKLAIKPGGDLPEPEYKPQGASAPHPDISKIDPNIPNILAPNKKNDTTKQAPPAVKPPLPSPNAISPEKPK